MRALLARLSMASSLVVAFGLVALAVLTPPDEPEHAAPTHPGPIYDTQGNIEFWQVYSPEMIGAANQLRRSLAPLSWGPIPQ